MRHLILAVIALILIAVGLWQLDRDTVGLTVTADRVGAMPVTLYQPAAAEPAPVVLIAHGFAGSQQLMQSFAITLARNGYLAVTLDLPGHGRHSEPLQGGIADPERRSETLREALVPAIAWARALPGGDGRVALLGHSMATDVLVRLAKVDPDIAATVAVSPFSDQVTAERPRNLLVIYGATEPKHLHEVGERILARTTGGPVELGRLYGEFGDGTARRLVHAAGVEHTGVLFSGESLDAARDWLDRVFERAGPGDITPRASWLGLLFLGILLLARPLSELLPRVAPAPRGGARPWRRLWPVVVLPAVLTPLLLWPVPSGYLPILLGDYLALHFGLYGLLTVLLLWWTHPRTPSVELDRVPASTNWWLFALATVATAAYVTFAIALPADGFLTSYLPGPERAPLILAVFVGTLAFFAADEWATRGPHAPRGAYLATKVLFLTSLAAAVLLNATKLFFLAIILPAMLIFFVIYGLFSRWAYRRTNHPLVGGLANALAFAWAIAASFPLVG
ncbi:alpha/beta fold hydrolase [Thioalkalicoccus limnaeus]|uniref:Alpha/beta fold hydrolase n=1 Tax=Thioalkalicoccus limnaeus TaxID=120681 RepID=A0ABV4BBL1_9GAMM